MKIYKTYFSIELMASLFCFFFSVLFLPSCSNKIVPVVNNQNNEFHAALPDYSNLQYWAAHPWKKDPSDSVPAPLKTTYTTDSTVDVFFIYPTTFTDNADRAWNANIDDIKLNQKTDQSTILYQASVFNASCRVFSPRYRQAHIRTFFAPDSIAKIYFNIAYQDIKNSFEYYLSHFNRGRPIIIAAHSQGTLHAARLLKEYFEGKILYNKLVCAYLVGLPVPQNYFSGIQACKDSASTGCVISWRTFKSSYVPDYVKEEKNKSIVVNPLTWTLTEEAVSSKKNKGGVLKNFNKIVPHVVSARIHDNILWASKPNVFGKFLFFKKNFHIGDINLFYMNIRENLVTRIGAFWKR
jgi:hypothetical protein